MDWVSEAEPLAVDTWVAVREGVRVFVWLRVPVIEPLRVRDWLREPDPVKVDVMDEVTLLVGACDTLCVSEPVVVRVCVTEGLLVELGEAVPSALGVAVEVNVPLPLGVCNALGVPVDDCERDCV